MNPERSFEMMSNSIRLTRVELTEVNTRARESSFGCLIADDYSSTYFSNYDFPNIVDEEQVVLDKWLLFNVRDMGGFELTAFINLALEIGITIDDHFYGAAEVATMLNAAEAETNDLT
jgi:hypothetical protein